MPEKKADDLPTEPDEIKSFTVLVSDINDVKVNPYVIVLRNGFGETWKCSRPWVIHFQKVPQLKTWKKHCFRLLQLYMPWRNFNDLEQDSQSCEDRYKAVDGNIKEIEGIHFL